MKYSIYHLHLNPNLTVKIKHDFSLIKLWGLGVGLRYFN